MAEHDLRRLGAAPAAHCPAGANEHAAPSDPAAGDGRGVPGGVKKPAGCVEPLLLFPGRSPSLSLYFYLSLFLILKHTNRYLSTDKGQGLAMNS